MSVLIAASSIRTCFGDSTQTFAALLAGRTGVGPLRHPMPGAVNVNAGYHIDEPPPGDALRASTWLTDCVRQVFADTGIDPRHTRVAAIIGTGLRELAAVEQFALTGVPVPGNRLHFGPTVRQIVPEATEVITLANACSAGSHALALAQDLIEWGEAEAVLVGAADAMTASMLSMIGRVVDAPTDRVRPFDRDRTGVLLGEGAAAVLIVPPNWQGPTLGRLLSTGLSCDATHETAPDVAGICRAVTDAHSRAGRSAEHVDLVVAHGTGTGLNDPAECAVISRSLRAHGADPLVTGVKGAIGHLSGAAGLANVDVALRCLNGGQVPPVVGLASVLEEGEQITFVQDGAVPRSPRLVQVHAFGFGGVNAVSLLERA